MTDITRQQAEVALQSLNDLYLLEDYFSLKAVDMLGVKHGEVSVHLVLGYPCESQQSKIEAAVREALLSAGAKSVNVAVNFSAPINTGKQIPESLAGVRNIVAVASGKGGVGKSTTSVNLALGLAAEGARVGILDADIHGPSQGLMLGLPKGTRPDVKDQKAFKPVEAHGIKVMSMAFLITEDTPVVWRGPKATGALMQLLGQTLWGELDYLIIDMPPGTGDIQLTLAQKVSVTGSVIVTTPQDIALLDAIKGVEMFRKVDIPVLGVVENMATHICSNCGHEEHLFGEGGGEKMAEQYGVDLLGSLPLTLSIRQQADSGAPTVASQPDSNEAEEYRSIARKMAAQLWLKTLRQGGDNNLLQAVELQ